MWLWCDHFATKKNWQSQRNLKRLRKILLSLIDRRTRSIASSLLIMHKRLVATDLVAQRFHWSPRGRKVVLFSSQTGVLWTAISFVSKKGITLRQKKNWQSQRNLKRLRKILLSLIDRRTRSIASSLLIMHKRLVATDLVAQRFHWSPRGRKVVLFSSQTGVLWTAISFVSKKGWRLLQPCGDLSVTDQRWGNYQSALHRRPVSYWLQTGLQVCANHSAIGLQYVWITTYCHTYTQINNSSFIVWSLTLLTLELGRKEEKQHNQQKIQLQHFDLSLQAQQLRLPCC